MTHTTFHVTKLLDTADRVCQALITASTPGETLERILAAASKQLPIQASGSLIKVDRRLNSVTRLAVVGSCSACARCGDQIRLGDCLCGIAVTTNSLVYSISSTSDHRHTVASSLAHGHVVVPVAIDPCVTYLTVFYLPDSTTLDQAQLSLFRLIGQAATLTLTRLEAESRVGGTTEAEPMAGAQRILVAEDEEIQR